VTLQVIFHELAERELNDAAAYYFAQERPGLGEAFWPRSRGSCGSWQSSRLRAPHPTKTFDDGASGVSRTPSSTAFEPITSACSRLRPSSAVLLTGTAGRERARSNKAVAADGRRRRAFGRTSGARS
jgi:hypothetical protein